ncbi:hypothetical protein FRB99_002124 [Tulasnella sp. 403]|nr:hypothetical protein FRB99_002124 [Tulasnella sp. 403]
MVFRPATPGFLTTLTATILLIVVSFSVPYFKTVYFLQATYNSNGINGLINFGTLGYCLVVNGNTTCTKPSIGYEFDPNTLLGNTTVLQIPDVVVKWITYALFLHVIALGLAAVSALFGLLAHVREFSMSCFSSCVSGAAAAVCLIAFIFDLVLFFVARARVRSIDGATAQIGSAIWLTLAAWVLLFISGCMFGVGRCCIGGRPRGPRPQKEPSNGYVGYPTAAAPAVDTAYAERMRMDAIKAEVDRKARQKASATAEVGLPAFEEYETRPLTSEDEPATAHIPYRDQPTPTNNRYGPAGAATGYVPSHALPATTPPRRQATQASQHSVNSRTGPSDSTGYPINSYSSTNYRPGDVVPTFPVNAAPVVYPPAPSPQPQRNNSARPASFSERDIYDSAGLVAASSTAQQSGPARGNDYLRPEHRHPGEAGYSHHTQDSSYYSAYSHQHQTSQFSQQPEYNSMNTGHDPTYRQPATYQGYSNASQPTYPPANYYDTQPNLSDATTHYPSRRTPAPANQTVSPTSSAQLALHAGYDQRPATTGPTGDLNFPGVPAPRNYTPPSALNTQINPMAPSSSAQGSHQWNPSRPSRSPTSPARLPGWREESETPQVESSSYRPPPDDAPPNYEESNPSSGYQGEKAIYRPS